MHSGCMVVDAIKFVISPRYRSFEMTIYINTYVLYFNTCALHNNPVALMPNFNPHQINETFNLKTIRYYMLI
jgi:hypothetical protein